MSSHAKNLEVFKERIHNIIQYESAYPLDVSIIHIFDLEIDSENLSLTYSREILPLLKQISCSFVPVFFVQSKASKLVLENFLINNKLFHAPELLIIKSANKKFNDYLITIDSIFQFKIKQCYIKYYASNAVTFANFPAWHKNKLQIKTHYEHLRLYRYLETIEKTLATDNLLELKKVLQQVKKFRRDDVFKEMHEVESIKAVKEIYETLRQKLLSNKKTVLKRNVNLYEQKSEPSKQEVQQSSTPKLSGNMVHGDSIAKAEQQLIQTIRNWYSAILTAWETGHRQGQWSIWDSSSANYIVETVTQLQKSLMDFDDHVSLQQLAFGIKTAISVQKTKLAKTKIIGFKLKINPVFIPALENFLKQLDEVWLGRSLYLYQPGIRLTSVKKSKLKKTDNKEEIKTNNSVIIKPSKIKPSKPKLYIAYCRKPSKPSLEHVWYLLDDCFNMYGRDKVDNHQLIVNYQNKTVCIDVEKTTVQQKLSGQSTLLVLVIDKDDKASIKWGSNVINKMLESIPYIVVVLNAVISKQSLTEVSVKKISESSISFSDFFDFENAKSDYEVFKENFQNSASEFIEMPRCAQSEKINFQAFEQQSKYRTQLKTAIHKVLCGLESTQTATP